MDLQDKVKTILGLASGKIKPEDIRPKKLRMEISKNTEHLVTHYIDDKLVTMEAFDAQFKKQFSEDDKQTKAEIIVEGVSMDDPDYLTKTIDRKIAEGETKYRQIGPNNWEAA